MPKRRSLAGRGSKLTRPQSLAGVGEAPRTAPDVLVRRLGGLAVSRSVLELVERHTRLLTRTDQLMKSVTVTVASKTVSGRPIQTARGQLTTANLAEFRPDPKHHAAATERLRGLGFDILHVGRFGISIAGPAELVSDVLGVALAINVHRRPAPRRATMNFTLDPAPPSPIDLFVAPTDSLTVPARSEESIDHFVFTPPPAFFDPPAAQGPVPG